jgi:hypothetical protein
MLFGFPYAAAATLRAAPGSTFTPGPMVEDTDTLCT